MEWFSVALMGNNSWVLFNYDQQLNLVFLGLKRNCPEWVMCHAAFKK